MAKKPKQIKDVHTSHCCIAHGCKYGDDDCTVTTGKAPQEYKCESCDLSGDDARVLKALNRMSLATVRKNLRRRFATTIPIEPDGKTVYFDLDRAADTVKITQEEYLAIQNHLEYLDSARVAIEDSEKRFYRGAAILTELVKDVEKKAQY